MLSFFPRGVLDEILNLLESVSEGFFPTLVGFPVLIVFFFQDYYETYELEFLL